ncbi:acyl-homoserine-lactone synthase [Sulfitobacter sabulilitoris]|uniref:acyl-homoserine-lactone synthase n=1 Tax=Sulfitobacter sabulilitoris TaxID=2562655 RepID=UPI001FE5C2F0|nr:acyl-homoserine-lactone synthase [Sulfitobacter sabulilitoris]
MQPKKDTAHLDAHVRATTVSFTNMHLFGELLVSFLRARHETFVVNKGWDLPSADGMEFDQYDTPLARWIIIHEFGEILAGVRLTPTTAQIGMHSYMIRDAQLGMLPDIPRDVLFFEAPVKKEIWEATRLFLTPVVASNRRMRIQTILLQQMAAAGRELGATHVIGIVPAVFSRWMTRLGMLSAVPVGPVMTIDGDRTQAALMNVMNPV